MSLSKLRGRAAWIFEERDFDIDLIIGVENIKLSNPDDLVAVTMKSYDAQFTSEVRKGDLLVGGENFGYGHPHYPAMISMRNAGIVAVVAESFAPGFWRGELYQGMPLVTVPGISSAVRRWDDVEVDWRSATVRVSGTGDVLHGTPPSAHAVEVIEAGGGFNLLRREYGRSPAGPTAPMAATPPVPAV
jgi:3-isopropylmalate/(R)-2-methylmalate dehydratase small subunit